MNPDITTEEDGLKGLTIAIAICGSRDQFVKKVGRMKAEGRLLSMNGRGRYSLVNVPLTFPCSKLLYHFGKHLEQRSRGEIIRLFNLNEYGQNA